MRGTHRRLYAPRKCGASADADSAPSVTPGAAPGKLGILPCHLDALASGVPVDEPSALLGAGCFRFGETLSTPEQGCGRNTHTAAQCVDDDRTRSGAERTRPVQRVLDPRKRPSQGPRSAQGSCAMSLLAGPSDLLPL